MLKLIDYLILLIDKSIQSSDTKYKQANNYENFKKEQKQTKKLYWFYPSKKNPIYNAELIITYYYDYAITVI